MALPAGAAGAPDYAASRGLDRSFSLRRFGPALALVALALGLQILLTDLPLQAYPARPAVVQLVSGDLGAAFGRLAAGQVDDSAYRLEVIVDGREELSRSLSAESLLGATAEARQAFFHELTVAPGDHAVTLRLVGETTGATFVLFDGPLTAGAGQVARPELRLDRPVPCPDPGVCAQ